ncbi:MAG: cyclic nucleotide-binding domain-containing protein [Elusimicrobia bacterium]|nr:cyclic nucleotide-binding domain-containing protein [Elusimicrobiota bacterium]
MNLKSVEIFNGLSDSVLKHISKILEERKIKKDTVIFEESSSADVFCLIAEGKVEVFKHLSEGSTKTLAILSTGDYFGEMSLFEDKPRIASVRAIDDVTLLEIKKNKFVELISSDLNTGMKLLSAIMSTTLSRLSATNSHLTLLYDTGKIIASSKNLKQMTADVFSNVAKLFKKADSGLISVYNEFTDELDVHSSVNLKVPVETIPRTESFVNSIASEKEIIINDDKSFEQKSDFINGKAFISSAFYFEDKFLGFILFASNNEKAFTRNDLILLSSVASLVSVSIRNISFISEEEARQRLSEMRSRQSF